VRERGGGAPAGEEQADVRRIKLKLIKSSGLSVTRPSGAGRTFHINSPVDIDPMVENERTIRSRLCLTENPMTIK
jgi:hypothetical protein